MDKNINEKAKDIFDKVSSMPLLNRTLSKKLLISVFAAIVVLVALLSLVISITEKKENTETTAESGTAAESSFIPQSSEILGNFLFVLTQDGAKDISLISVVRIDSENGELTFAFLSPDTECSVNGYDGTMQQHLENGGINELLWAVGEYANISIERYVWGDEEAFVKWMKNIPETTLEIKEKISYNHNGISFIIEEGIQTLTADNMLKYFVYLCKEEGQKSTLVETMLCYVQTLFASEEDGAAESLDSIVAYFNTNISVVDCSEYKRALRKIALNLAETKVTVVEDLSFLK